MRKLLIFFFSSALASSFAMADDDPPGRAARLSYVNGTVTFQPDGEEKDWAPADLNRALTTGDKIWVETGGRTEIQTVNSAVRLNGHTNYSFLTVDDTTTQIQLSLGVMLIRLRGLDQSETYEIDTPQAAFTLLRPGIYRIEVNEAGDTTVVTVRGGEGEITADGKASPVHLNEQVAIRGTTNPIYDKHGMPNPDEFDGWAAERDRRADSSISKSRVAPGVVGVSDLDVAGSWRPAPTYGNVWFPTTVVADWAPYRYGHWGYVAPWGWTWIDDAPWGYAPFHYGRWVMVGGAWGWAPGPIAVHAVYSPALVSFIGGVEVVGVADPVSWVALSWGEPWYPSFGVSYGYYNRVNLCGTIFAAGIIAGVWGGAVVNLSFGRDPRAVVVMGRGGFAGGHPCGREFVHRDRFGAHSFDHAGFRREGVRGIGASREARFGGHAPLREGSRGFPPHNAMGRPAVVRHAPAAAGHAGGSFRGSGVAANHGPSANGGHAGSFHNASNSGHAGGAGNPGGGSHGGSAISHGNMSAGGSKGSSPSSHGGTPVGGSKGGNPASHSNTPAGGSKMGGSSASHGSSPAGGGSKGGSPATHTNTPAGAHSNIPSGGAVTHSNTPAGGSKLGSTNHSGMGAAGAGNTGRSGMGNAASGVGHSPNTGSAGAGRSGMGNAASGVGRSGGAGGGAPHNPVGGGGIHPSGGGGGAPKMGGGAPTHASAPTTPHKK